MKLNNNIFEKGNIGRLLLKFCIPAVFAMLVTELYNMVDTVYVGHYMGPDAIAGLTVAFPIQRLLTALGLLVAVGGSTYAARSFGEKNSTEVKKTIITSLSLALALITVVSLMIVIFIRPVLYGLGASDTTYPLAKSYVSIILISAIFQSLTSVICYTMISFGKTRALLYANLIGVIFNVVFNHVFVVYAGLGITGSAVATVISQMLAFAFAAFEFKEVIREFKLKFTLKAVLSSINKEILSGIVAVGFSTFVIEFADALVAVVLNNVLHKQGGDEAIVMVGLTTKISMFMFVAIVGISSAMQPIIAYNFGAENYDRMKKVLKSSIKTVISVSLVCWVILMAFSRPIIGFLLKDAALLDKTVNAFRTCILLLPLVGVYYVGIYYYQAIGEAKRSFLLSIYRETVIFIPMSILFVQLFGVSGVWAAYPVTDAIVCITSIYLLHKNYDEKVVQSKVGEAKTI